MSSSCTCSLSGTTWWDLIEFIWPIGASFDLKIKVNNFWIYALIIKEGQKNVSMMSFLQRDMFFWWVILILVVVSAPHTAAHLGIYFLFIQVLHPQFCSNLAWVYWCENAFHCMWWAAYILLSIFEPTASSKTQAVWNQPPGNVLFCAWWRLNGGELKFCKVLCCCSHPELYLSWPVERLSTTCHFVCLFKPNLTLINWTLDWNLTACFRRIVINVVIKKSIYISFHSSF